MIYSRQPRPWPAWVSVALLVITLPLILMGLWISCSLEPLVYRFCLQFKNDPQIVAGWQVISGCRVIAWVLLPLSLIQLGLATWTGVKLRSPVSPGRSRKLKHLFTLMVVGVVVLLGLEAYWVSRMAPVAALMQTVSSPTERPTTLPQN